MINSIDVSKCTGCGTCFKTCGLDVFRLDTEQPVLSPCMAKCPAGTDMRAYNYLMQVGKIDEAAAKLRERNPFPAITGRVCPHQCESECSRAKVDGAVNINAIEQYLGDRTLNVPPAKPRIRHAQKVAVAGSGPAGLSCAWFLARKGYQVKVFEALPEPGGMLRYGIPAYRLPDSVVDAQVEQLRALGVEFQCGTRVGKGCDVGFDDLAELGFKALFVAPGNGVSRRAGIAGEELTGVFHGVEFLRDVRMGRVPRLSGRAVVIGGGDVAVDAAITAKLLGADHVDMICLEQAEEMPAFPHNIEDAKAAGIGIHPGWGPLRVEGDGKASGIMVRRCLSFLTPITGLPLHSTMQKRGFLKPMPLFLPSAKAPISPPLPSASPWSAGALQWTASPLKPASGIFLPRATPSPAHLQLSAPLQGGGKRPFPLTACYRAPTCTASVKKTAPWRKSCPAKACAPHPGMNGNAALFPVLRNAVSALMILTPSMRVCAA